MLGLGLAEAKEQALEISADEIARLIDERMAARKDKDFARADEIRDRLVELGVVLEDSPAGTTWRRA